jgi:hypothetical protein
MSDMKLDDELIQMNEERGPGWFLKIAYAVISLFCIYYLYTYWDWKSDYEVQQQEIQSKIAGTASSNGN